MVNLIKRIFAATAPSVKKPRLVAALLIAVITIQPNIVRAETVTDTADSALVLETEEPEPTKEEPPTIQETLLTVCETRGYGVDCAKILLGMAYTETNFKGAAVGDRGQARGWFQIWPKHHTKSLQRIISLRHPHIADAVACAEDLACSADWTISYLESNSYPKYVSYAIQCHNGCNANNGYVNKVRRYAAMFWDSEAAAAPHIALAK